MQIVKLPHQRVPINTTRRMTKNRILLRELLCTTSGEERCFKKFLCLLNDNEEKHEIAMFSMNVIFFTETIFRTR